MSKKNKKLKRKTKTHGEKKPTKNKHKNTLRQYYISFTLQITNLEIIVFV